MEGGAGKRGILPVRKQLLVFGARIWVWYNEISARSSQVVDFHRVFLLGRKKEI
jgi:hypothetical protein